MSVEGRLAEVRDRLEGLDRRVETLEQGEQQVPTATAAPGAPHPPEPFEPLQRAETVAARAAEPDAPAEEPAPWRQPALTKALQDWPLWRLLAGGNTVVRVGVVILFFGVAFLLKYAHERFDMPIELRLVGVAAGAVVLLVLGWRLRARRPGYALTLQGGGIGILYLVIFAAFRLYSLLPPAQAFVLLVVVAALSAMIAIVQDALALAVLGASGGFLAPILASTGGGSHVMLFSYYAVLNAGILAVAWFKAWRVLNLVGFGFTFSIGTVWGVNFYRPEHFTSTEPFLALFFIVYLAIPILYARRRALGLERYVDGSLVFGVPLVTFGLQVGLVHDIEYGAAWSALILAAVYLVLAKAVFGSRGEALRLLAEAFLALGVVFGSLAIPLALDGRWTSAAWALEGAAIVWVGVRQQRLPARIFGLALQFLAGAAFLADQTRLTAPLFLANSAYLGCVFLAVAGLFCAWYLDRHRPGVTEPERVVAHVLFGWGIAWWVGGALGEIDRDVPTAYRIQGALVFFTASCAAFSWLHTRLDWRLARYPAQAVTPLMVVALGASAAQEKHPMAHLGYVGWPLAFGAHVLLLRRHEAPGSRYQYWAHAAGVWLLAVLGSWEIGWGIGELLAGRAVWPLIAWALVPGALLTVLALRGIRIAWPVAAHRDAYLAAGAAPLAGFLVLWGLVVNFVSNGDPAPLPYVPILSPLDLAEIGALLAVALWFFEVRRLGLQPIASVPPAQAWGLLAALVFVWTNAVLLRTLHHWGGVRFALDAMLRSDVVQTAFSILWTLVALASMGVATRRSLRAAWIAGAVLMAVVVVKLFMIDLSNAGTIQRIVSFVGVGVLMLVLGYFSPVPPRSPREAR
ncbi:MAG TPA: DUF2339 domain-containing protein [Candidatus Binatia bacterium]|nr:DUF2339 domain-containing protein [Candidatus Binatia bacterium]